MFKQFKLLPEEIQNIILEYGSVKYRDGKYISQIARNDERYNKMLAITRPIFMKVELSNHPYTNKIIAFVYSFNLRIGQYLTIRNISYYFMDAENKPTDFSCLSNDYVIGKHNELSIYRKLVNCSKYYNDTIMTVKLREGVLPI